MLLPYIQVFDAMRRYKLGTEQATRALVVSITLELIISQHNVTPRVAIQKLTQHLRKAKLAVDPYDSTGSSSSEELESLSSTVMESRVQITLPKQKVVRSKQILAPLSSKINTPSSNNKNIKADIVKRDRVDSVTEEVVSKLGEAKPNVKNVPKNQKSSDGNSVTLISSSNKASTVSTPVVGRGKRNHGVGEENDHSTISSSKRSRKGSA